MTASGMVGSLASGRKFLLAGLANWLALGLLQQRDLAAMICHMLHRTQHHEANIIRLPRHRVVQLGLTQSQNRFNQLFMVSPKAVDCLTPRFLADVSDVSEVLLVIQCDDFLVHNSRSDDLLPRRHMQNQLPDTVGRRNRMRGGSVGIDVRKYFHKCRPMPRFTIERTLELLDYELDLRHMDNLASAISS